jgi:hypothetical protein
VEAFPIAGQIKEVTTPADARMLGKVTTSDESAAVRARLQSVENDLLAAGKRNVTIEGAAAVFTWAFCAVKGGMLLSRCPSLTMSRSLTK